MQMKTRGQTWPVGWPVGEGSSLKDQILQEECELPPIGTSRAGGQRGSGRDVVRKRRRSHAGALDNMSGKGKVMNGMSNRFLILSFFLFIDSTASWS